MKKNIPHSAGSVTSVFFLLLDILLITVILSLYQLRYLDTSFAIGPFGNPIRLELSKTASSQLPNLKENTFIKNETLKDAGYSLGFEIKTSTASTHFFSGSSEKGTGSIYWVLNLIDGKIQTSRLGRVEPTLVNRKINDSLWHRVLISLDKELKIFIDDTLESRLTVRQLLPGTQPSEKWFNFYPQFDPKSQKQVELRNVVFVNKTLSPTKFDSFIDYFKGDRNITEEIARSLTIFFTLLTLTALLLVTLIKRLYPKEPVSSIVSKISSIYLFYSLAAFSLWTNYAEKIIFFSTLISLYYLSNCYRKLLPESISLILFTPMSALHTSFRLLLTDKGKLFSYLQSIPPWVFFLLLVLFVTFFVFDPSSFIFIP